MEKHDKLRPQLYRMTSTLSLYSHIPRKTILFVKTHYPNNSTTYDQGKFLNFSIAISRIFRATPHYHQCMMVSTCISRSWFEEQNNVFLCFSLIFLLSVYIKRVSQSIQVICILQCTYPPTQTLICIDTSTYTVYKHANKEHTHTHIYIYIRICIYTCTCICMINYSMWCRWPRILIPNIHVRVCVFCF
jgi:hypothetical protein